MAKISYTTITLILSLLSLTACKVGPDYLVPDTCVPPAYTEDRPMRTFDPEDEELIHWWKTLHDPFLDCLLETALEGNFDYRIALEKVRQARAEFWIQFTGILPDFIGSAQATHYRFSQSFRSNFVPLSPLVTRLSPIQDFFQIGLDAIWELDFFGKLRRSAEASHDLWEATIEDARGVKIMIVSEVIVTYVYIAALQEKIAVQKSFIELGEDMLNLSTGKFEAGLADLLDVKQFRASLEQDKASYALLDTELHQRIYSLSVLLGKNPEDLINCFQVAHPIPNVVGRMIPAGLPGELLRRRPDIASAERKLAGATERIGVAVADLYPSVSLVGSSSTFASNPLQGANYGYASDRLSQLLKPASRVWGYGAFVKWPILDFGKRCAGVQVQESLANQAYLEYRKTVVAALEEAENALVAYFNEEQRLGFLKQQTEANHTSFQLAEDLYNAGLSDYLQLLEVKQAWLLSLTTLIDSKQALVVDLVSVYKAMGGDW